MKRSANAKLIAASCALAVLVALVGVGTVAFGEAASATDLSHALLPPGSETAPLGSDQVGRDVLLRTLAGGGESVLAALAVVALSLAGGVAIGVGAAYAEGGVEAFILKVITVFQAFPSFVLAIAIAGVLGPGMINMIVAIAAVYWTIFARVAHNAAASFRSSEALDAAKLCGAGRGAILARYLAPCLTSPLITLATLSVSDVVLTLAGLSFLGLGPERPTNEWGALMAEAQPVIAVAPWCVLVPAGALLLVVVAFNLYGDALRDHLDYRRNVGGNNPLLCDNDTPPGLSNPRAKSLQQ